MIDTVKIAITESSSDLTSLTITEISEIVKINLTILDPRNGLDGLVGSNGLDGQDGVDGDTASVNLIVPVNGNITLKTDNIPEATVNYKYVTDAEKVVLSNTSGTNTGDETAARIGTIVNAATDLPTPLDADKVGIWDSLNSLYKAVTWANIKVTLKAYFDTIYLKNITVVSNTTTTSIHTGTVAETYITGFEIPAGTFTTN